MTDELFSVADKTVVITGGSSGIGLMLAHGFAARGANVYISSRKADMCAAAAADIVAAGGRCQAMAHDLSTEDGCRALAADIAAVEDRVDVLINNAGATWGAPLDDFDDAAFEKVLAINVKGVFHTTKFLLPLLQAAAAPGEPARVINIGSIDGLRVPVMETYSYSASKAAVHQLTRHLGKRLAPDVTVNAIAPGPFHSRMMRQTIELFGEQIAATTPMRRLGEEDDVVGTAVFLSSRAGRYLTGAVIPVDGGISTLA